MPPVLSVSGLEFRYPSYPGLESSLLYEHLDLEVQAGECVRILGGPESGKSTLARILCGLVPRYTGGSIEGSVRVAGVEVAQRSPCDLIESVGIVFQSPDEQIVTTRCSSEVAFALESLGVEPAEMRERVREALDWAGLAEYSRRGPLVLSGGEKRRLLLACLYAIRPAVWVLDETVEELDVEFRGRVLRHLRDTGATTLLFASKEIALPEASVDVTFRLEGCRLVKARSGGSRSARGRSPRRPPATAPSGTKEPLLEAEGLEYAFPGRTGGAFHLSVRRLVIYEGEVVGLAGPNGAGKSTLARLLCGLFRPASGRIRMRRDGAMQSADSDELKASVAYVFQNPDYQIFLPTVREELCYGLIERGEDPEARERHVAEAVSRFALPGPEAPTALLSYGARKRLQIAVYHLLVRAVVILDEADAGLTYGDFVSAVRAFADRGSSVIAVSHDHEILGAVSDRVLAMERGALQC